MRTPSLLACLFFLPIVGACADDDDISSGSQTESSETGDGDGDPTGDGDGDASGDGDGDPNSEVCPEPFSDGVPNGSPPPPYVTCDLPSPCPVIPVDLDQSQTTGSGDDVQDLDGLNCVLQGLEAGTAAEYRFDISGSISSESLVIRVYAKGNAEYAIDRVVDSAWDQIRRPVELDTSADFATCSTTLAWDDVWPCIQQGMSDCEVWGTTAELCES